MESKHSAAHGHTVHLYLAEEFLVGVGPIDVGGVEERDAGGGGVVDERDHVGLRLRRAVVSGHAHAAKAKGRDLKPLRAQLHPWHHSRSRTHCLAGGIRGNVIRRLRRMNCFIGLAVRAANSQIIPN
ncbi:hypothetical protein EJB05_37127, partial [Eragrostis curvula]